MLAEEPPPPVGSLARGLGDTFDDSFGDTAVSCSAESWRCPGGDIVVLHVAGEIDLLTDPTLRAALDAVLDGAVDRATRHVVVDMAGVTFCGVRGFALLADTGRVAAARGTGYAISGLAPHLQRHAQLLWTGGGAVGRAAIRRYRSAATAVTAIRADRAAEHRCLPDDPVKHADDPVEH